MITVIFVMKEHSGLDKVVNMEERRNRWEIHFAGRNHKLLIGLRQEGLKEKRVKANNKSEYVSCV